MNKETTATQPSARSKISDTIEMQARVEQTAARVLADIFPQYPTETLRAVLAKAGISMEVWDADAFGGSVPDWYGGHLEEHKDGRRIIVVPAGQDPALRLHIVRQILAKAEVTAR